MTRSPPFLALSSIYRCILPSTICNTMAEIPFSLDKSTFSVSSLSDAEKEDKAHWLSKTPQERLAALEKMRQINYAYDPVSDRLQRILDVAGRL